MNFIAIAAVLSAMGLLLFAMFTGSSPVIFIDVASVLLVPVVCTAMLVATFGWATAGAAMRDGLSSLFGSTDLSTDPERAQRVAMVANSGINFSFIAGLVGGLVGLIQMLQNLSDPSAIGPAMAVALLTAFYAACQVFFVFMPMARSAEATD